MTCSLCQGKGSFFCYCQQKIIDCPKCRELKTQGEKHG